MALDATVGGENANSFSTVAEYKAYWGSRPNNATQLAATDAEIEQYLIHACRVMSAAFTWTGAAVTETQALSWPRSGMLNRNGFAIGTTVLPQALKDAHCELAGQMAVSDRTADNDAEKQGVVSVKAGSVAVEFRDPTIRTQDDVDAQQLSAITRIIPDAVRLLLVPSWYAAPALNDGLMFEAL